MIDTYRCKVGARRWPMVVWYTIVDVSALNGFIVWTETHPEWVKPKCKSMRAIYLKTLGMELIRPHVQSRSQNLAGLTSDITQAIGAILGTQISATKAQQAKNTDTEVSGRGRCHICVSDNKGAGFKKAKYNANKTTQHCKTCCKFVCNKHSDTVKICRLCNDASDTE